MIETLAEKMAFSIKKANEQETASLAVMKFALIIIINLIIPIIVSLLIGAATGNFLETLFSLSAFITIRMLSGGYHFSSPIPCMTAMIIAVSLPPHLALPENWTVYLTTASLFLFFMLAPSNLRGYHTMPEKYYPMLKIASVLLVCSNYLISSQILALVLIVQGMSLFKWKEV
jgi:accessory gene regulator B